MVSKKTKTIIKLIKPNECKLYKLFKKHCIICKNTNIDWSEGK